MGLGGSAAVGGGLGGVVGTVTGTLGFTVGGSLGLGAGGFASSGLGSVAGAGSDDDPSATAVGGLAGVTGTASIFATSIGNTASAGGLTVMGVLVRGATDGGAVGSTLTVAGSGLGNGAFVGWGFLPEIIKGGTARGGGWRTVSRGFS